VIVAYVAAAYLASLRPLPLPSLAYFSSIPRYSTYALAVPDTTRYNSFPKLLDKKGIDHVSKYNRISYPKFRSKV
jgi:hypothetical protein